MAPSDGALRAAEEESGLWHCSYGELHFLRNHLARAACRDWPAALQALAEAIKRALDGDW